MAEDKKRGPDNFELPSAPAAKRAKKKPTLELDDLPKFIYDPEAEKKAIQEESEKHGGRVRTLPVLAGHWPTHIYLSCKIPVKEGVAPTASDLGSKSLSDLSVAMSASSTPWTLYDYKDLHISLAKTFSLRHSEIQTFCERLGEAVTAAKTGGIALSFDRWRILVNDAKTTSFASLVASSNVIQILGLIEAVDSVMKRFDHPTYYENPIIHASLAWTPSDTLAQDAATKLFEGVLDPEIPIEGYIKMVYCKVGKVVYSWPLE